MRQSIYTTPEGTRDLLFEECVVRREVEQKLMRLFFSRGYSEVMTPGMEFYDTVVGREEGMPPESLYKFTDNQGRLLVMRPDSTLPIARLAATRLQNTTPPVRLCYAQDVFHLNQGLYGYSDQEFQMGVELLGVGGKRADMEVIALAAASLKTCFGDGFRLEIGHADFFGSLVKELAAPEEVCSGIRELIESKNYAALGNLLEDLPDSPALRAVRQLPRLFGGEEVLKAAEELYNGPQTGRALSYLKELYRALCELKLEHQVMIDLGMVHRQEYYTGVIFRGYIEGSGETVLSGGRYDRLLRQFGPNRPATGFAINVDSVTKVRLSRGDVAKPTPPAVLLHPASGCETAALKEAESLADMGTVCEVSVFDTLDEAKRYAEKRGIKEVREVSAG